MASGEELSSHSIFSKNASPFLKALELVNCHHEELASLQSLGVDTQFYAYCLLRNHKN
jgi:hypothetical protein